MSGEIGVSAGEHCWEVSCIEEVVITMLDRYLGMEATIDIADGSLNMATDSCNSDIWDLGQYSFFKVLTYEFFNKILVL